MRQADDLETWAQMFIFCLNMFLYNYIGLSMFVFASRGFQDFFVFFTVRYTLWPCFKREPSPKASVSLQGYDRPGGEQRAEGVDSTRGAA